MNRCRSTHCANGFFRAAHEKLAQARQRLNDGQSHEKLLRFSGDPRARRTGDDALQVVCRGRVEAGLNQLPRVSKQIAVRALAVTLGSSDVDAYGIMPRGLTPTVPTAGVCKLVFVALVGVFVEELAEVFDLWRDDQEPFVEDVEFVDVVDAEA